MIASDGVWDVLGAKEILDILLMDMYTVDKARFMIQSAIKKGSMDNISCIVLKL